MGHIRLGGLPHTRKWKEVIALMDQIGSEAAVASATLEAVEEQFIGAAGDPTVIRAVYLLTQLPDAARSKDFQASLAVLGITVSAAPTAVELASAVGQAVDTYLQDNKIKRSDIGEMARLSAIETLVKASDIRTIGLFGLDEKATQDAIARIATEKQFGVVARDFFARLTERVITFYVSKELPLHTGPDKRFHNLREQQEFQEAVALHARQASVIVETFAGGWYSKARFERQLNEERTRGFVGYAMKKLRTELRMGAIG